MLQLAVNRAAFEATLQIGARAEATTLACQNDRTTTVVVVHALRLAHAAMFDAHTGGSGRTRIPVGLSVASANRVERGQAAPRPRPTLAGAFALAQRTITVPGRLAVVV